jgi:hypothetical protein
MNLEDDYYEEGSLRMLGSAHAVSDGPPPVDDVIARLHAVVKEVTGKDVEPPQKPRMGFL